MTKSAEFWIALVGLIVAGGLCLMATVAEEPGGDE